MSNDLNLCTVVAAVLIIAPSSDKIKVAKFFGSPYPKSEVFFI